MELSAVLAGCDTLDPLEQAHRNAGEVVDPHLLALCADRMAMLLGHQPTLAGLSDERKRLVAGTEGLSEFERACLALVEHYLIDVASVPDELVAPVRDALGDQGLVDLLHAVLILEQRMRLELIWERIL